MDRVRVMTTDEYDSNADALGSKREPEEGRRRRRAR